MTDKTYTYTRRLNPRRGILIFEMAAAITITAVLLYSVASLLSAFSRIDRTARERMEGSRELWRLVEQLRGDVHGARQVERPQMEPGGAEGPLLRLIGAANDRIEYHVDQDRVLTRLRSNADKVVEREAYDFGPHAQFSIELSDGETRLVTLLVSTTNEADDEADVAPRVLRITAVLARDYRYRGDNAQESAQ